MRKRMFCAAALLCGASLGHAQGFAGTTATGVPASGFYGNQGYHVNQVAYSPEYAAYVQQAQAQAAMAGYGGAGYPGASPGYAAQGYGYGYPAYGYGYPVQAQLPAAPGVPMAGPMAGPPSSLPALSSGMPVMPDEEPAVAATGPVNKDRFWVNVDYTATYVQPQRLATPLVTAGASADPSPGALGQPGTSVLFGSKIDSNSMDGVKIDTGFFLDEGRVWSLEYVAHIYAPTNETFAKQSDASGVPLIARPIFNVNANAQRSFFDSFPNQFAGGINVDSKLSLFRTEFNVGCNGASGNWSGATIFGLRYMRLSETLTIRDNIQPLADGLIRFNGVPTVAGDNITDFDSFRTRNSFYGGQLGGRVRWDGNWVFVAAYGKVGLGVTEQNVEINGGTTLRNAAGTQSLPGGILALPTNIGSQTRTVFSYSPEAGLNLGLKLTQHVALSAGYSFTYWSHVVRPGKQIDPNINPTQIPTDNSFGNGTVGPSRPLFNFNDEDLYLHTLSLGLNIQY